MVLYDLYTSLAGTGAAVALAVMIAAYAGVGFRSRVIPTWVTWVSVAFAVGSLTPLAYLFVGGDMLWIACVSVVLYRTQDSAA